MAEPRSRGPTTASMEVYDQQKAQRTGPGDSAGLVLLYAPGFERLQPAYPLTSREVTIGRELPADILIPQPAVSRTHARLSYDPHGCWVITDLGARNGTIVNGKFITQAQLQHMDVVRVGDGFFKFVATDTEGYLPYRIDGAVLGAAATPSGIVGGYQLATISQALRRIAQSSISVILFGESGTGKEVFARQIHQWSERGGAFCALNCAAIPATLLESELFGYRRGAFSGADRDHVGLVRAADKGTLFLDEIGDMPLEAQAKLLRVLQTKQVLPLGATVPETVDIRIVCATHRNLTEMQAQGLFRGDLFARLNEYNVMLPALRHRKEDIYAFCEAFLRQQKRPDLQLSVPYMTGLFHYDFPYNVRELEALIKRGVALCDSQELSAAHLSAEIHSRMSDYGQHAQGSTQPAPPPQQITAYRAAQPAQSWRPPPTPPVASHEITAVAQVPQLPNVLHRPGGVPTEAELREVLASSGGNVAAVGRYFGKERMQVHRWMKRYSIDPNEYRGG